MQDDATTQEAAEAAAPATRPDTESPAAGAESEATVPAESEAAAAAEPEATEAKAAAAAAAEAAAPPGSATAAASDPAATEEPAVDPNDTRHPVAGLIFDLDGTLVDSRQDLAASANAILESLGRPTKTLEEVTAHIGHGVYHLMAQLLDGLDDDAMQAAVLQFQEHYAQHCVDSTTAYPGALEILEHFKDKPCAVVSNKPEHHCRTILKKLSLDSHLMAIVGGDTIAVYKPDPAPFEEALALMGLEADDVVVIGDHLNDIEGARAVGAKTCAVTYGWTDAEALKATSPDFVIDELAALPLVFR